MSTLFDAMHAATGRPSIPPKKLLWTQLIQMLYPVRSEACRSRHQCWVWAYQEVDPDVSAILVFASCRHYNLLGSLPPPATF